MKRHAGCLTGTAEVHQIPDRITAVQRTGVPCQEETRATQQTVMLYPITFISRREKHCCDGQAQLCRVSSGGATLGRYG